MHTYQVSSGYLSHTKLGDPLHDYLMGICYSGYGLGLNNPLLENVKRIGPMCRGMYDIVGNPFDSPKHGRFCLRFQPRPETIMFGRSGLLFHGDSIIYPGLEIASEGCVIGLHSVRLKVWENCQSGDREWLAV